MSNPTEQRREVCERCGRPKITLSFRGDPDTVCFREHSGSALKCQEVTIDSLQSELATALARVAGSPDDLRALGWSVAVHNDYKLDGHDWTFWLFTKGHWCIKGEGQTDAEALDEIRRALATDDAISTKGPKL